MKFHFLPPERREGDRLRLEEGELTHLCRVLRLAEGALRDFVALDGSARWTARLEELGRKVGWARIVDTRPVEEAPRPRLVLALALLKGDAFENALRMACELGVDEILPLAARRSVRRVEASRAAKMTARWERLVLEACQQCGRPRPPRVHAPLTPAQAVGATADDARLLLFTVEGDETRDLDGLDVAGPADRVVFVGPEGDFAPDERALLLARGATALRLRGAVLRAETAAPVCLALVAHRLGKL